MFSLTCAQKTARILASASELKAWEQRREERSERLQAARRAERKQTARFPPGYGPGGRVPAYVEAHVLSLEKSPLAGPVFSCGRGIPPSSRRRPKTAPATPQPACALGDVAGRDCIGTRPATACPATTGRRSIANPCVVTRRPTTAGGGRTTKQPWQQRKRRDSASSPLLVRSAGASREGRRVRGGGRVRPATAPCRWQTTTTTSSREKQQNRARTDTGKAGMGQEEARLVEKLARLSGVQPGGDFPTVAALKTAVAIKALQQQLQGCRARSGRTPKATPSNSRQDRAAWYTVSTSSSQAAEGEEADGTPSATTTPQFHRISARVRHPHRKGHRDHELEPWDDRPPHSQCDTSPGRDSAHNPEISAATSTAASLLRTLTSHDPVFGRLEVPSPARSRRHSRPHPATPPSPTNNVNHLGLGAPPAVSAGATTVANIAPAPHEIEMQACFRRLTVGTLIELNHLRNPPKPVQAVLDILACLLGWKKHATIPPGDEKVHDCRHPRRHRRREQRGQSRPHNHPPRTLFSNAYAVRDVLASISPRRISDRRLSALAKRLGAEEAAPAKVRSANIAAAVLLDWILAVVACARVADDATS